MYCIIQFPDYCTVSDIVKATVYVTSPLLAPGTDLPTDGGLQEPEPDEKGGCRDDCEKHAGAQQCAGAAGHYGV